MLKYFLLFVLLWQHSFAQTYQLRGVVITKADNSRLAAASIFISNTSIGTTSNSQGEFTLDGIRQNNFELIVSYTGFETVSIKITPENMGKFQTVVLNSRNQVLPGVLVRTPEKDGWEKWGRLFTESFIGQSDFARDCTIENPEVLVFFNDKKNKQINAYSNGNLIIENKALGYLIRYQLEDFRYDFDKSMITFIGYTGFEDLYSKNKRKRNHWLKARSKVYEGSILHFMRSLYVDSVEENGFEVHEKIRIKDSDSLFDKKYRNGNLPQVVRMGDRKYSVKAPTKTLRKIPEFIDIVSDTLFSFKDAVTTDSTTNKKLFYFDNYIEVVYKKAWVKIDYLLSNGLPEYAQINPRSEARLISGEAVAVSRDGSYYNPINFMSSGFWGWCKMAEALPIDY